MVMMTLRPRIIRTMLINQVQNEKPESSRQACSDSLGRKGCMI